MCARPQYPDLLTTSQVARLLGTDVKSVYRQTQDGTLPVVVRTVGGQARYSRSVIEILLAIREEVPNLPRQTRRTPSTTNLEA